MLVVPPSGGPKAAFIAAWTYLTDRGEALGVAGIADDGHALGEAVELAHTGDDIVWIDVVPDASRRRRSLDRAASRRWRQPARRRARARRSDARRPRADRARGQRMAGGPDRRGPRARPRHERRERQGQAQHHHLAAARRRRPLRRRHDGRGLGDSEWRETSMPSAPGLRSSSPGRTLRSPIRSRCSPRSTPRTTCTDRSARLKGASAGRSWGSPRGRRGPWSLGKSLSGAVARANESRSRASIPRARRSIPPPKSRSISRGAASPRIGGMADGFALLAPARVCKTNAACDDPLVLPTFVRFDAKLAATQVEPLRLGILRDRASAAWGLACDSGKGCLALAATTAAEDASVRVLAVNLSPRSTPFRPPTAAPPPPGAPTVNALDTDRDGGAVRGPRVGSSRGRLGRRAPRVGERRDRQARRRRDNHRAHLRGPAAPPRRRRRSSPSAPSQ